MQLPRRIKLVIVFGAIVTVAFILHPSALYMVLWYIRDITSNVSIQFYGKVVDQDNHGVAGVGINSSVSQFDQSVLYDHSASGQKDESLKTITTTERGIFIIDGVHGQVLEITDVSKAGYEYNSKDIHFFIYDEEYGAITHSDPVHPIIFHMWKKGESAALVSGRLQAEIVGDGREYTFDFVKKKAGDNLAEGDLKVVIQTGTRQKRKFDWSAVVEPINGKIVETHDIFPYLAPEHGYQPNINIAMFSTNANWSLEVKNQYYLYSRSGQVYSSIDVMLSPRAHEPGLLTIEYRSNPLGSRNLQP